MERQSLGIEERVERRIGRESRVRSLSVRFTKTEEAALTALAAADGKTVREWAREALLASLKPAQTGAATFTELLALRLLLNGVLRKLALGERMTPEQYQQLVAEVRRTKHDAARDVLAQYQPGTEGGQ